MSIEKSNRLTVGKERSPTDPHECCVWANARLEADGDFDRRWIVTGDKDHPIALVRR